MTAPVWTSALLNAQAGVRAAFFGAVGGVSQGIYASLNAGPGSGDAPEAVAENRRRIATHMGVEPPRLVSLHQVHSARAVRVSEPWAGVRPEADAMVTTTQGLALTALSADCAPVLLVDTAARIVGSAHAGWRGAVGGVLEACVEEMRAAGATRIIAAIGPCIHQDSYEVGPDLEAAALAADAQAARFFRPGARDRLQFDLPGYCRMRLERCGVADVETAPLDTYVQAECFSHRRNTHAGLKDYGRNCAAISLL